MPNYKCNQCGKVYNTKEFDLYNKDSCSHDCLIAARLTILENEETKPERQTMPQNVGGGGGFCF